MGTDMEIEKKKVVIVTGMSGAGKSTALKNLEDFGYLCVDNLPIDIIPSLVQLTIGKNFDITKIALGIDVRNVHFLEKLETVLDDMKKSWDFKILFLDASDECLVKRYKESRRTHPLAGQSRIEDGIKQERVQLEFLRKKANFVIDTSSLLTRELRSQIEKIFIDDADFENLIITILSFGFKYGIPNDADLVFDVRCLPNPYYIDEMKHLTGNDSLVGDYVMSFDVSVQLLEKLADLISFLIPNYILEGKNQLVIAVGCTGGKHRSVTIANELYNNLKNKEGYGIRIEHRDIQRDSSQ